MQVPPEDATSVPGSRNDDSCQSASSRPPQVKAGDDHHDRPAGGQLDEPTALRPKQKLAMNIVRELGNPLVGIENADDFPLRRNEYVPARLSVGRFDVDEDGISGFLRQSIA